MSTELLLVCPNCPPNKAHEPKLYVNPDKGVFNCFRCNFRGPIKRLGKYPAVMAKLQDALSLAEISKIKAYTTLAKSSSHEIFEDLNPVREVQEADPQFAYLENRGWTEDMFALYTPLVSLNPEFKDRVILPIFSEAGDLVYFTARSIDPAVTLRYKNAESPKAGILFKSQMTESAFYEKDAVICEGIFDAAKIPSAISLLGKSLPVETEGTLMCELRNKTNIFICLDSKAETNAERLASMILGWFPLKNVYIIDTAAYKGKDLGDISKEKTPIELILFVKKHSKKFVVPSLSDKLRIRLRCV